MPFRVESDMRSHGSESQRLAILPIRGGQAQIHTVEQSLLPQSTCSTSLYRVYRSDGDVKAKPLGWHAANFAVSIRLSTTHDVYVPWCTIFHTDRRRISFSACYRGAAPYLIIYIAIQMEYVIILRHFRISLIKI